jgi:hypothetical protein
MSLQTQLVALANAIGADIKTARNNVGSLSSLTTTQKGSIVAAINEIKTALDAAAGGGAVINDSAGDGVTTQTWSANKIFDTIAEARAALKDELVAGAGAALDTFAELATAMGNDPTFAATLATQMGNRVRFDSAQTLTAPQKAQACDNIGIGDPEYDLAAAYNTAKA